MTAAYRTPEIGDDNPILRARLHAIWETAPGWRGWIATVDHKEIGIRYIVTAFVLLAIGGLEALAIRLQLAGPDLHLLTPEQYNQFFSTHGMTMIFLYALPVLSGFSNYLWPLMIGSRDMAFPRLNALSYWIFLFSAFFFYVGFLIGAGPNDGWFNYVPYAEKDYNPGYNQDFYSLGMVLYGISTTVGAANFIVTRLQDARARHVDQPAADPDVGHAHRERRQPRGRARRQPRFLPAVARPAVRARISS